MRRALCGFEESQAVCKAMRAQGIAAYSADLKSCTGGRPEWHIKGDIFDIINDGWDMGIFHPPCTDLAVSGSRHFEKKIADGRQQESINLFMRMLISRITGSTLPSNPEITPNSRAGCPDICTAYPKGLIGALKSGNMLENAHYMGNVGLKTLVRFPLALQGGS